MASRRSKLFRFVRHPRPELDEGVAARSRILIDQANNALTVYYACEDGRRGVVPRKLNELSDEEQLLSLRDLALVSIKSALIENDDE